MALLVLVVGSVGLGAFFCLSNSLFSTDFLSEVLRRDIFSTHPRVKI